MGPVHCIRRFLVDLFGHVLMQVVAGSPRHPCFIEISRAREKIWNPPREGPAIIKKKPPWVKASYFICTLAWTLTTEMQHFTPQYLPLMPLPGHPSWLASTCRRPIIIPAFVLFRADTMKGRGKTWIRDGIVVAAVRQVNVQRCSLGNSLEN